MKPAILLGISLLAGTCFASAEPPTTVLGGVWVLDVAKSDFGGGPAPTHTRLDIKVKGVEFHVAQQGDEGDFEFNFRADGQETTNTLPDGGELKAKYRFDGDVLIGDLNDGHRTMKDRITVSANRKTLIIDRVMSDTQKLHMVFNAEAPTKAKADVMAGSWKCDMTKSDFGGTPFSRYDANIRVDGHDITAEHITDRGAFTLKLRDDGTETANELGAMKMKGKMQWEGDVLVGVMEYANADGVFATYHDRTTFSADGKTMNMDRTAQTPRGEIKMKIVLVKQ